jgi:hypothetical protein
MLDGIQNLCYCCSLHRRKFTSATKENLMRKSLWFVLIMAILGILLYAKILAEFEYKHLDQALGKSNNKRKNRRNYKYTKRKN